MTYIQGDWYQELMSRPKGWKERLTRVEQHLNLNSCDTSLIWTYSQVGSRCCFYTQRATLHAPRSHTYSTGTAITVNESQPWNKKEDVGSKVSESGKCCTRTCTSHMASGFENGQVALPFEECGTLSYFRCCATSSLGLLQA